MDKLKPIKMKYIKSPLNYVGGKYKLLNQIIPLFPDNIENFIDLFGGGFNVGINVNANKIIYNDISKQVVSLMKYLQEHSIEDCLNKIHLLIEEYQLSKENKEGYLSLRKDYNESEYKDDIMFYTLICYSFNNQIRFNNKGEYNMPFGKNRSSFNSSLSSKFIDFHHTLQEKNCVFLNNRFEKLNFDKLNKSYFIYVDSPYLNSVASYNENNGWTRNDEETLLNILDKLDKKGIKFALSNNLKYENDLLDKWKDKYNVHYLTANYSNCNYQKKDKGKDIEILVTNY